MEEEECHLVIDNGSHTVKPGYSGEDDPRPPFETIVSGCLEYWRPSSGRPIDYVGHAAYGKGHGIYRYPIQQRIITNWEDMEKVWHHTFYNELRVQPEEHCVLLTEPPSNPKSNRETTVSVMFERFNVPSMYLSVQPVLSLFASGRTSGIVLDSGYEVTHSVSISDGYALPNTIETSDVGGKSITNYLAKLMNERGCCFITRHEMRMVKDIKKRLCFIRDDLKEEVSDEIEREYELPDGQVITIGSERYRCAESLFDPSMIGSKKKGVHSMIHDSIMKCDENFRSELFQNIVLSGGSTMFPGMDQRLSNELAKLTPDSVTVKVIAPPERKYSTWIGGSILSSLSSFSEMCITKDDFQEEGATIIHRKCF